MKAEDTQCLRADVAVEPSFYVLFAGTLALALLNSFVMKATAHYFHDRDYEASGAAITISSSFEINELNDLDDYESYDDVDRSEIRPVPVLFSDRFRWGLHREDTMLSQKASDEVSVIDERIEGPLENPVSRQYDEATDLVFDAKIPVVDDRYEY